MSAQGKPTVGGTRVHCDTVCRSPDAPLVTVITAVFNGKPHMKTCIESVLRQDYPNIEHIVLDGGSTDGTVDVLREYDARIALWKSEPDLGVYHAWNQGLSEAQGEWICFLGVDDEFLPGAVRSYMELAANNTEAEYLSSKVNWVHSSGYQRTIGDPWTWPVFSRYMCTAHVGSMHRRSLFAGLGTYDTSYRIVADYELLLRAGANLKTAYLPISTVMMRGGGISDSMAALDEQERAKIRTGGRNRLLAAIELWLAKAKFSLHPLLHGWQRLTRV